MDRPFSEYNIFILFIFFIMRQLSRSSLLIVFALIYIGIDLVYVWSSRGFYESRLNAIQGSGFPNDKSGIYIGALATYAAMAVGWALLVARQITPATTYRKALGVAVAFAAIVHGVFNGTLYAMFKDWDLMAVSRDILWGLIWISTITLLYLWALKRND
jgi:hypothetical protein